jgi:type I restriction enzyme S subunit
MANPSSPKYCDLLHVSAENIESVTGKLINLKSAKDDGMTSNKYFFDKGDVLYSKLRPYLRKIALPDFSGLCSADMYPIKCNPDLLDSRFLKLLLTSKAFTEYANEMSARSRMPKLNRDQLYNWKFSLPSIEIQQSITSKIEHAMKIGDEGLKASDNVIASINILPNKLLQEAFNETEND